VIAFQCEDSDEVQSYALSDDYFRFMFAEEVEPTNNHSEQQIRHCVIDRRITQGTRSEAGERYQENVDHNRHLRQAGPQLLSLPPQSD